MNDVLQRAGMPALLDSQSDRCFAAERFANLGERIVQAARMAVIEHLRQIGQSADQTPFVIGGADHAAGDFHSDKLNEDDREAA